VVMREVFSVRSLQLQPHLLLVILHLL